MARLTVIGIEAAAFGVAYMSFVPNGTKQGDSLVAQNCSATTVIGITVAVALLSCCCILHIHFVSLLPVWFFSS